MNSNSNKCPLCGIGDLSPQTFSDVFTIGGQRLVVHNLEGSVCNSCGADPILQPQILRNQVLIADAKREHLGLLKSHEILFIREFLGLTQKQASERFGGGANAFSKYERGEVIQSEPMDKLLRAVYFDPQTMANLNRQFMSWSPLIHTNQHIVPYAGVPHVISGWTNALRFHAPAMVAIHSLINANDLVCVMGGEDFQEVLPDWLEAPIYQQHNTPKGIFGKPFKKLSTDDWESNAA